MANTMTQSRLCSDLHMHFMEEDAFELSFPVESKALASYVKNHRINPKNLFEVINLLWPPTKGDQAKFDPDDQDRLEREFPPRFVVRETLKSFKNEKENRLNYHMDSGGHFGQAEAMLRMADVEANMVVYDVNFPDGSQGMVISENGIGVEYHLVS